MKHLKYFEHRKSTTRSYNIKEIIHSYIECSLFTDGEDDSEFDDLTMYDISDKSKEEIREQIEWFINIAGGIINQMSDEQLGYDIWYTRNGHGTGFSDRGYPDHDVELLKKLSDVLGSASIFGGDEIEHDSSDRYKDWNYESYMKELEFKKDVEKYNL